MVGTGVLGRTALQADLGGPRGVLPMVTTLGGSNTSSGVDLKVAGAKATESLPKVEVGGALDTDTCRSSTFWEVVSPLKEEARKVLVTFPVDNLGLTAGSEDAMNSLISLWLTTFQWIGWWYRR